MKVILIRHFKTKGNLEKRYVGKTDESVIEFLNTPYPSADLVFTSPLKRCTETAQHIYGEYIIEENLKESDFGIFENKNYDELKDLPQYINWLNGGYKEGYPQGESFENFNQRCLNAFLNCTQKATETQTIAFVVHGGVIMSLLSQLTQNKDFYHWQVKNGKGFVCQFENNMVNLVEYL